MPIVFDEFERDRDLEQADSSKKGDYRDNKAVFGEDGKVGSFDGVSVFAQTVWNLHVENDCAHKPSTLQDVRNQAGPRDMRSCR
jgi:hypothetical protein